MDPTENGNYGQIKGEPAGMAKIDSKKNTSFVEINLFIPRDFSKIDRTVPLGDLIELHPEIFDRLSHMVSPF